MAAQLVVPALACAGVFFLASVAVRGCGKVLRKVVAE